MASRRTTTLGLESLPPAPVADLRARGRALRADVARSSHGTWDPPPRRKDPVALLRASNRTRLPELVPIRIGRMMVDPFTYLRGSPVVMANDLAGTPVTGIRTQICGDLHLLNFGVYASPERILVFDVNDFDETLPGPWEWDLKRLVISFEVAARVNGQSKGTGAEAVRSCVAAYQATLAELAQLSQLERWYVRTDVSDIDALLHQAEQEGRVTAEDVARSERNLAKARARTSLQATEKLTEVVDGHRRFVDDPPVLERITDEAMLKRFFTFAERYRSSLVDDRHRLLDNYVPVDLALKVVGVGSVGTRCLVVLLEDGATGSPLLLQIKEAQRSVLEPHAGSSAYDQHGRRVVEGQRLMQATSDIFLGWGRIGPRHFYVRQLRDMKGSAQLEGMPREVFLGYAQVCGAVAARAHAKSVHPALLNGYAGTGAVLGDALVRFAKAYGDQIERDHAALVQAVRAGKLDAIEGV